jgi:hypothetical protein
MAFLSSINQSWCTDVLGEWCESKDLMEFDSALCSKEFRATFLSTIQLPGFVLQTQFSDSGISG